MATPFLKDISPTWGYFAVALLFTIPVSIPLVQKVQDYIALARCTTAAAEWEKETGNGRIYKRANTAQYGLLYASYKKACPTGSVLVDEGRVPAAVRSAAENPRQKLTLNDPALAGFFFVFAIGAS